LEQDYKTQWKPNSRTHTNDLIASDRTQIQKLKSTKRTCSDTTQQLSSNSLHQRLLKQENEIETKYYLNFMTCMELQDL